MMDVDPGQMDKKILLFRQTAGQDADGFRREQRVVVRNCFASVKRLSGTESLKAGAELEEETIRFLCRYASAPLDTDVFVEYRGNIYNVLYVNDYGDGHEYVELLCRRCT